MTKRYNLEGVGSNVQLGKKGNRVKSTDGVEFRNSADDAYVPIRGADGVGQNDFITKGQFDYSIKAIRVSFDFQSQTTINIGNVVDDIIINEVAVNVMVPFDDVSATLSIGNTLVPEAYMEQDDVNLNQATIHGIINDNVIDNPTQLTASLNPGSSTQGAGYIIIEYFNINGSSLISGDEWGGSDSQINLIGAIMPSVLTEGQFQTINGTGWILADGRDVTGSEYHTLTGNTTIPDTRGAFFRGLDTSGTVDPDGASRSLGDLQQDAFGDHSHSYPVGGTASMLDPNPVDGYDGKHTVIDELGLYGVESSAIFSSTGGTETRPKNIAVNYFININS